MFWFSALQDHIRLFSILLKFSDIFFRFTIRNVPDFYPWFHGWINPALFLDMRPIFETSILARRGYDLVAPPIICQFSNFKLRPETPLRVDLEIILYYQHLFSCCSVELVKKFPATECLKCNKFPQLSTLMFGTGFIDRVAYWTFW